MPERTDPDPSETDADEDPSTGEGGTESTDSGGTPEETWETLEERTVSDEDDDRRRLRRLRAWESPAEMAETPARTERPDEGEDELDKRERRLKQRELGLDKRAEKLDEREQELDERERRLDVFQEELSQRFRTLQEEQSELQQRKEALDEREQQITEAEEELSARATEREHEGTRHDQSQGHPEELDGASQKTVLSTLDADEIERESDRFGPTGTFLTGVAGLVVVAFGVGYGVWAILVADAGLFGTAIGNFVVAAVLVSAGFAINLAPVLAGSTGRSW